MQVLVPVLSIRIVNVCWEQWCTLGIEFWVKLLDNIPGFHLAMVTFFYFGNIWYSNTSGRKKLRGQFCCSILPTRRQRRSRQGSNALRVMIWALHQEDPLIKWINEWIFVRPMCMIGFCWINVTEIICKLKWHEMDASVIKLHIIGTTKRNENPISQ